MESVRDRAHRTRRAPGWWMRQAGSDPRKVAIASVIRMRSTVDMQWINERLQMKSAANASHQFRRMKNEPGFKNKLSKKKGNIGQRRTEMQPDPYLPL